MDWKKPGKVLLFPHPAVMIILLPVAAGLLAYALAFLNAESPTAIAVYTVAFYTLLIWCFKIPVLLRGIKNFKRQNKYARTWLTNVRLRVNVSLYGAFAWNAAYALLHLGMGVWHRSFWFYALAGYYLCLAAMRLFLARHTSRYQPGENMLRELRCYRACGTAFLIMNLTLALIIFFMVYWNRTFHHHEITAIALAAYTFTSFTLAIVNMLKYRKYNSPVYSASKIISFASACVSMLTLEATMLTAFAGETMVLAQRRLFLGISGGVISAFIIVLAIYMIAAGTKKLKQLQAAAAAPPAR